MPQRLHRFGFMLPIALSAATSANAATVTIVHSFGAAGDAQAPSTPLLQDATGNLTGGTYYFEDAKEQQKNTGTIYRLAPDGSAYSIVSTFAPGIAAVGALTTSGSGAIIGSTFNGGPADAGIIFRLNPDGRGPTIYAFTGLDDGKNPVGVASDRGGNVYVATSGGGASGNGTIVEVTPAGRLTVLHTFTGPDGDTPGAPVARDSAGTLYGTTEYGGAANEGVLFSLTKSGIYTVLHSFTGGKDGANPVSTPLRLGNLLYGTTATGGQNHGTVFRVTLGGVEKVLYRFKGRHADDGATPAAGLVADASGNLYGTTAEGGDLDAGTAYEIDNTGAYKLLVVFRPLENDEAPEASEAPLIIGQDGALYGTSQYGGDYDGGTVFKLTP